MYNDGMKMNNNNDQEPTTNDVAKEVPYVSNVSKFNVEIPQPRTKRPALAILIGIVAAFVIFLLIWVFILKKSPIGFITERGTGSGQGQEAANSMKANPLTGIEYPQKEAEFWLNTRPMAVMVNNYIDARPQSGLVYADLVYEVVAEGGITRFLAFYLSKAPEKIGPVRSTREYYLVLVKELGDAMLMHIGWSPQALEAIETWPVRSLGRGGGTFWRENPRDVAVEHTAYTDGMELRTIAENIGWDGTRDFVVWVFKDEIGKYQDMPEATNLSIDFWYQGDYSAIFEYDQETNTYLRSMGYDDEGDPIPHKDQETQEQVRLNNVIVQFAVENPIAGDDKSRLEYELVGSGNGLVFIDGRVIEATWTKEGRDDRTLFYDGNGDQIEFNRGKFWISIVPDRNVDQVVYN